MKKYNTTQLNPKQNFQKHVYHRDQFAHYLRWTHVLKKLKIGMNILDWGCGSGELCEVAYRNRYKPKSYIGIDIRKKVIQNANMEFSNVPWAEFIEKDLCDSNFIKINKEFDIISSFEVIEHIGKENVDIFLNNMTMHANKNTIIMISTPVYDEKVGAAKNHIINGNICEFEYDELEEILKKYFKIINVYGTFASQKDYKPIMNEWQMNFYNSVKEYFDSNILSNLMAPMFPKYSRNCMWILQTKDLQDQYGLF